MNRKSFLSLALCILASLSQVRADGFIVVHEPTRVPAGHYPFAPLEVSRHLVDVKIEGQIATTTVDEEFYNPNDRILEGTYLFPVPKDAHIDKFSMDIGGKMTEAELLPADKARKIYEDIVRKMRDPALLEYAGRDVFKARIFPIEPRSRKQVKIVYSELLKSDTDAVTYTYPLGTEKFSAQPIKNLAVTVRLKSDQPIASIYSPSHKVEIKRDGTDRARVSYEAKNEKPDTDFQLVFTREKRDVGLHVMTYKAESEDGYFLLLAAPSVDLKNTKPAPKDVVFVLDTSGSMAGAKLKQAKKALEFCVDNLNEDDRFEIVRFSTECDTLFDNLAVANEANRKRATEFIGKLKAIGGTAIADALKTALKSKPPGEERPFVIIFLTDGLPTVGPRNQEEILAGVRKIAGNARIFSFGIGNDVNTHLLDQLAESTRAFSQYVLPEEDIEVKLSSFFTRIKEPALTNVKLEFSGDVHVSKLYPSDLPDLFKGDQLVLTGRYTGSGEVEARLTGRAAGQEQSFTYKVRFDEKNTERDFIPRLWATRRIGFLLDEIRLHGQNNELRDEVTALARQYGIVTPYTAYLIIEDETRRNVPLAQQSLREMNLDKAALGSASEAWGVFQQKKDGSAGVGNAQSQNVYKYAEQVNKSTMATGGSLAMNGYVSAAPAARAFDAKLGADRVNQYTQQTKFVNGRAFFQNGKQWVDGKTQGLTRKQKVQFNSDAYFELLAKHSEAAQWLALGSNMTVALDDTIYEITD